MGRLKAEIPPFEYLKGNDFTNMLLEINGVKSHRQLADIYGIPASTISTWNQFDRTAHELILRAALHNPRLNLRAIALGEGKFLGDEQLTANSLPVYKIIDGRKVESGTTSIDEGTLERYGLNHQSTEVIDIDSVLHFVDMTNIDPFSGHYLIDFDGRVSINKIQRLPGKKLSVVFSDTPTEISENDIKVIGRVAARLLKD
ncbi:helix-turn-helix domain-containing protein [Photobacterium sp. GJ3]|uniref:helix-turn-helix domain-containing protein n=1 Tax=Photobacterium sp. GJ3 TaxID=2829502 RepID=UPI001B8AB39A|nr:helix-turn-helix domain-containing protein [Photobacterium sp. GJ3]QUJ67736.1 helix-turn-helix domain-containing protein [Photobacterium sp. GJ3]